MATLHDRTLALAGILQATSLVNDIATTGKADQHDEETCLRSVMELNPVDIHSIYGHVANLSTGLKTLIAQLGQNTAKPDLDIARYTVGLLHLERKLSKRKTMLEQIAKGISRAKQQLEYFPVTHENIIANLGGLYSDTISQIPPKIMVSGENHLLTDASIANRIRALLLCGMRSALLWRQLGGSRWQLLWKRAALVKQAQHILTTECPATTH